MTLGENVLFTVYDGIKAAIWKSDGTIDGTTQFADYVGEVSFGGVVGGSLIFGNSDDIWKTDGINDNELLYTGASVVLTAGELDGWVYFASASADRGYELYRTRGKTGETELFDLVPGPGDSVPQNLRPLGDGFVFDGRNVDAQEALWYSDGTLAGTRVLYVGERIEFGGYAPRIIGDNYHFFVEDADLGIQAWRTDGTIEGTRQLRSGNLLAQPARTKQAVRLGDRTVLTLFSDGVGEELWVTDGSNTTLLADLQPGTLGSFPTTHIVEQNLWMSRQSEPGITSIMPDGSLQPVASELEGFHVIPSNDSSVTYVTGYGNDTSWLYRTDGKTLTPLGPPNGTEFVPWGDAGIAFLTSVRADGLGNVQLWGSDGTPTGTRVIAELADTRPERATGIATVNEAVFFIYQSELWSVRESHAPELVSSLYGEPNKFTDLSTSANGILVFGRGRLEPENRKYPIWSSDGTSEGTQLLLETDRPVSGPTFLNRGVAFFSTIIGEERGLWRTDGSTEGTYRLANIQIYEGLGGPMFAVVDEEVYFVASNEQFGRELWRTDGTVRGTNLVADLTPGPVNTLFTNLSSSQEALFFTARHPNQDAGIWTSDGTAAGTYRIAANLPLNPQQLRALGDRLYFAATDEIVGRELFSVPIPSGPLVGDLDANGKVDFDDFLILSASFGKRQALLTQGDLDGDTLVGFADFLLLSANYGAESSPANAVDAAFASTS